MLLDDGLEGSDHSKGSIELHPDLHGVEDVSGEAVADAAESAADEAVSEELEETLHQLIQNIVTLKKILTIVTIIQHYSY